MNTYLALSVVGNFIVIKLNWFLAVFGDLLTFPEKNKNK